MRLEPKLPMHRNKQVSVHGGILQNLDSGLMDQTVDWTMDWSRDDHYPFLLTLKVLWPGFRQWKGVYQGGGHYVGDCTPTRDQGQSEIKRSRRNFGGGQAVKVGIRGSLGTVKGTPLQVIDGRD